jgi:bacterioferritin-associated ferredoxin
MIICLCKGITDQHVQEQLAKGLSTKDILKRLGVGSDCGICVVEAIDQMQAAKTKLSSYTNHKQKSKID